MDLKEQLLSILFSFSYGIIFSYLYNLSYNFLYKSKILYRILINILFCLIVFLVYFLLIKAINFGIVHPYFLLSFAIGFIMFVNKSKYLRKCLNVKNRINEEK